MSDFGKKEICSSMQNSKTNNYFRSKNSRKTDSKEMKNLSIVKKYFD